LLDLPVEALGASFFQLLRGAAGGTDALFLLLELAEHGTLNAGALQRVGDAVEHHCTEPRSCWIWPTLRTTARSTSSSARCG
jgi:hypothetical protein